MRVVRFPFRLARAVASGSTALELPPLDTAATALLGGGDVAQVAHMPAEVAAAFGINAQTDRVDRGEAMTIPAVRRGRMVVAGTIGALPLVAVRGGDRVERPVLEHPDPNTTRQHVLTWTVDDLIFYGVAWWRVTSRDGQDYPLTVERVAPARLRVDLTAGVVYVDDRVVPDRDLVRFDGPDEGVLAHGGRTLRTCLVLEAAVRRFARLDVPLGILRLAEGAAELTRDEVDALLDEWEHARATRSTAFLNRAVDYSAVQFDAQRVQLAEARQYQSAEVARLLNLPPRYVNAPQASGMTYSNLESERRDLVDTTLAPFLAALEQRLSLGDVTPRGTRVRVDTTALLRGDTTSSVAVGESALRSGVMTPAEVRERFLGAAPRPDVPDTLPEPRP